MMIKAINCALLSLVALMAVAAASSIEENTENVVDYEDENGQGLSDLAFAYLINASRNYPFMDLSGVFNSLNSGFDNVVADEPEAVTENQVALVAGEDARDFVFTLVHNETGVPVETDAETQKQLDALFALVQKPSFTPAELVILKTARDQLFNSNYSIVIGNVSTSEATVIGNCSFGSLIANQSENVEVASASAAAAVDADFESEIVSNSIDSAETGVVENAVEMTADATGSAVAATTESSVTALTEEIMPSESVLSSSSSSASSSLELGNIPASVEPKRIDSSVTSIPKTVRNRRARRVRDSSSSSSSTDSSGDDESSSDDEVEVVKTEVKSVLGAGPLATGNVEGIDLALAASTIAQDPESSSYSWKFYTAFATVGAVILAALGFLGYMHFQKKQSAIEEESDF